MRIGIKLPTSRVDGTSPDTDTVGAWSERIEAAGFDGVWVGDGSFRPGRTQPDPLMWLLVAAAATRNVELGSAIYQVPLRHPVDLAQRFMTLHALSRGRLSVGVGAGSTPAGHAAVGAEFSERFASLYSHMSTIRTLLAGEVAGEVDLQPWPDAVGGPRFLLGAWHSERSLRRAAEEYDGWLCSAPHATLTVLKDALVRYRDFGGTRAMIASCSIDLSAPSSSLGPEDGFDLRCGPEEARERLGQLIEIGYDDIVLTVLSAGQRNPFLGEINADRLAEVRALTA